MADMQLLVKCYDNNMVKSPLTKVIYTQTTLTNRHFTPAYSLGNNQATVYMVNWTRTVYLSIDPASGG